MRRRARTDLDEPGAQRGGMDDRGKWHYRNLATYITNYPQGAYEDFDGEPDVQIDRVDLTTVHKTKGLEWRVAFVPSLAKRRFPSSMTGRQRKTGTGHRLAVSRVGQRLRGHAPAAAAERRADRPRRRFGTTHALVQRARRLPVVRIRIPAAQAAPWSSANRSWWRRFATMSSFGRSCSRERPWVLIVWQFGQRAII